MRYLIRLSLVLSVAFLFIGYGTKEIKLTEGIQPGYLAPEIHLQEINLKGTGYVLLQFWAAYDPQSRLCNTRMHNLVARGKMTNLRLISVSFDKSKAVFEGIVRADSLDETTQFYEPDGRESAVFKNYHLEKGFNNWLIDSNGVIVAKNVGPNEILARFY